MYLQDIKTGQVQIHHAGWCLSQVSAFVLSLVQHLRTRMRSQLCHVNATPPKVTFMFIHADAPQAGMTNFYVQYYH
jgi:hypothetical protein